MVQDYKVECLICKYSAENPAGLNFAVYCNVFLYFWPLFWSTVFSAPPEHEAFLCVLLVLCL